MARQTDEGEISHRIAPAPGSRFPVMAMSSSASAPGRGNFTGGEFHLKRLPPDPQRQTENKCKRAGDRGKRQATH